MAESLFGTTIPGASTDGDVPYNLGTRFSVTVAGTITKIRWYAVTGESGAHSARLYAGTTLIGGTTYSVTASGPGWIEHTLPTPVSVSPGTVYTVAVTTGTETGNKNYAYVGGYFSADGGNGQHLTYTTPAGCVSVIPANYPDGNTTNCYFRDVIFEPEAPTLTPLPDSIAAVTNLAGAVTDVDEDPASPDASWLTATSATSATDARFTFQSPTYPPAGAQAFRAWLRKTTGTPTPTVDISLYQGGTLRSALVTGTSITSTSGQLVTATWNSSNLSGTLDGSDVECLIHGNPGTTTGAGALPAYSAAGTVFTSNTMPQTNLALNSPTHVAGDLLIALVCCRNSVGDGTLTTVNGTGGTTGWTLQNNGGSMYGGAQLARIGFGWKVAASASEVCSITTTGGTTTDRISARVYKFTAANGFATPAVANVAAGTTGTLSASQDMTMPTVAAGGAANGLAVCLYGISESSTQAAPTGATGGTWTEPVAEDAGTNATTGIFIADDSDAGGITGGTSASGATSGVWANVSLRLNPADALLGVNTVEIGALAWDYHYATTLTPTAGVASAVGNSPTIATQTGLTLNPARGTVSASGSAPGRVLQLGAIAGAITGTGTNPGAIFTGTPTTGLTAASGIAPSLSLAGIVSPSSGTATASGNAPSLTLDQNSTAWLFPVTTNDHSGTGSGTTPIGDGTAAWYENVEVKVADGIVSYIGATNMPSGVWTDWLRCLNYPNNIPSSATIRGIEVRIYLAQTSGAMTLEKVCLLNAGGWLIDSLKTPATPLTGSYQLLTFGGPEDSWGIALTPALCASATFGVGFQCSSTAANTNAGIDYVQMRIHFVVPLVVGEGAVAAVGVAPGLVRGIGVEAGAGVGSGATSWLGLTVGAGAGAASATGAESKLSLTIAPQEGMALATGAAPAPSLSLTPAPTTASAAGNSPNTSLGLILQSGLLATTGATPQVLGEGELSPFSGQASASGNAPILNWTLASETGAALATGAQPSQASTLAPQTGLAATAGSIPDPIVIYTVTDVEVPGEIWGIGNAPPQVLTILAQAGAITAPGAAPDPIVIYTVSEPGEGGIVWGVGNAPELTQPVTTELIPEQGVVLGVGGIPTLSRELQAIGGVVTGVGNAPDVALQGTLVPQVGAVLAVGDLPTNALALGIQGGTAGAEGTAPTLQVASSPIAGIAAFIGSAPALTLSLSAQSGTASAIGAAPSLGVESTLTPVAGVTAASGNAPALTLVQVLSPQAGQADAAGASPSRSSVLQAIAGQATAVGTAPSLYIQTANTPITGLATASGNIPSILLEVVLSPVRGIALAAGAAPALSRGLSASSGAVLASGTSPTITLQTGTMPITGMAAASGNAPALARQLLAVSGQATAQGSTSQLSLTLPAQAGLASATGSTPARASQIAPAAGLAAASGSSPTLSKQLTTSVGLASAQGNAPARTLTLQAVSGTILAAGNQPTAWLQAENSPLTGVALASGAAPTLSRALAPARGIATASGTPPHVSTGLDLTPQTSLVQASGNLPPRRLAFGPAPTLAAAIGSAPSLAQVLAIPPDGIILARGPSPALAQTLAPTTSTAFAVGNEPERLVTRFIFPESGSALATAAEASTLTLILELSSTTVLRAVGNAAEVQLALPGNRRETALTRLYARLLLLTPGGVLAIRNSTIPLVVPPAGAVVMLDSGPDTTDRGISEDFYEHRVRLELFIMKTNPLAKTIQDLEDEVAATLAGDRTLGGVVDQMHLFPTSSLALTGGGTPIDINALSVSLTYGEPHAGL